jgi:Rod binding domain-containing protein
MTISALASHLAPVDAGLARTGEPASAADRQKVAAQFEAILVRQLLGPSLTAMLGAGSSAATSVYGDMLTDTLAQQLTAGPGLGLGRLIATQLAPRTGSVATPIPPPKS